LSLTKHSITNKKINARARPECQNSFLEFDLSLTKIQFSTRNTKNRSACAKSKL